MKSETEQGLVLLCQYCGQPCAYLPTSIPIYGTDYGPMYQCQPCGAYVGCHPDTDIPLGHVANAELRDRRKAVKAIFNPLWQRGPKMGRAQRRSWCYAWLARKMEIPPDDCHVGHFGIKECNEALKWLKGVRQRPDRIFNPTQAERSALQKLVESKRGAPPVDPRVPAGQHHT